jgi:hypothetical protein
LGYLGCARIREKMPCLVPDSKSDSCRFLQKKKLRPGKLGHGRDRRNGVWVEVRLQLE